jgi:hypothetical protein
MDFIKWLEKNVNLADEEVEEYILNMSEDIFNMYELRGTTKKRR